MSSIKDMVLFRAPNRLHSKPQTLLNSEKKAHWKRILPKFESLLTCYVHDKDINPFLYLNGEEFRPKLVVSREQNHKELVDIVRSCRVTNPRRILIVCMDERLQWVATDSHTISLGLPGCDCLVLGSEKKLIADYITTLCRKYRSIRLVEATSHSSCGAVAKSVVEYGYGYNLLAKITKKGDIDKEARRYAASFASIIQTQLKLANLDVAVDTQHINKCQMDCAGFHNGVGAVINFDPLFNPSMFSSYLDMPLFNVFAGGQNLSSVSKNTDLADQIAGGTSGFGHEFLDESHPFVLLITTSGDAQELNQAKDFIAELGKVDHEVPIVYKMVETI